MNGGEPSVEPSIEGSCDSRFSAVRDAFRDNFRLRNELGAALCIYVDGHRIVDLWGGHQDGERHRKWQHDTLVNIYMVGETLRSDACSRQSDGPDRVTMKNSRFGLGFQLSRPGRVIGGSEASYGHAGYGGSLGFADPASGVAFAYLTNRPGKRFDNERAATIIAVLYEVLGKPA